MPLQILGHPAESIIRYQEPWGPLLGFLVSLVMEFKERDKLGEFKRKAAAADCRKEDNGAKLA